MKEDNKNVSSNAPQDGNNDNGNINSNAAQAPAASAAASPAPVAAAPLNPAALQPPFQPQVPHMEYFGENCFIVNMIDSQEMKASYSDPHFYSLSGQFDNELATERKFANRRTGILGLDSMQAFYPGFYCLGAVSSLGKTTLALQIASNLAADGIPVFYFSLEQSMMEMHCKSLARTLYGLAEDDPTLVRASASDIRFGNVSVRDKTAADVAYRARVGNNLKMIYNTSGMSAETIVNVVLDFMTRNPAAPEPVIFVDYLQILEPSVMSSGRVNTDVRANINHAISVLKSFQVKYNATVVAISALNRENYIYPVDFSSFKETGSIEYTANVIWGLQLTLITQEEFNRATYTVGDSNKEMQRDTTLTEKREMINAEKAKPIRKVDLVVLKNRFGVNTYTVPLDYKPKYDIFLDAAPDSIDLSGGGASDDSITLEPESPF